MFSLLWLPWELNREVNHAKPGANVSLESAFRAGSGNARSGTRAVQSEYPNLVSSQFDCDESRQTLPGGVILD